MQTVKMPACHTCTQERLIEDRCFTHTGMGYHVHPSLLDNMLQLGAAVPSSEKESKVGGLKHDTLQIFAS